MSAKKTYDNVMGSYGRPIAIGVALVGLLVVLYVVVSTWLETRTDAGAGGEQGSLLTYPVADYRPMADALFEAMDGYGTDEQAAFAVLRKLRTPADYAMLAGQFGTRANTALGQTFSGNLNDWLTSDEFTPEEQQQIRTILSSIHIPLT